jgi:YebC/PmpR family DNA-binding regulatory protein
MAGHSKWANIKHKKGAADAKRGRVFTKLIKEITVAARIGGSQVDGNPRLRLAVDKARAQSVPKDNIERAIKKGLGELGGVSIEEVAYEGYGPAGVALLVDGATDNKTRTVAEIRNIFAKKGGNMGETGSVSWMFEKKGVIRIDANSISEESLFEKALEVGADDIKREDDVFLVTTSFEDFHTVQAALAKLGLAIKEAGVEMLPKNTIRIESEEQAQKLFSLIEALEDNDDVQNVWANFDIDEAILEKLAG